MSGGFDAPGFTFWNIAYTAIGAAVLWGTWGRNKLKVFVFSDVVALVLSGRAAIFAEFAIFILLGCLVGIGIARPTNPAQALSAGLGWTAALARPRSL
jgi:hypothetical protein